MYFTFLALATFVLHCWDIHVRGSIFFIFFVSNCLLIYVYEFFTDICLYCVLFEIKILSVSGNIQVDSIKLLSTLAIDG